MRAICVYNRTTNELICEKEPFEGSLTDINIIEFDIPEGKEFIGINQDGEPIIEDKPLTLEERLAQLEASQSDQDDAIAEIAEIITEE